MQEAGLEMTVVDYQPLYRSSAGTGSGMAFAYIGADPALYPSYNYRSVTRTPHCAHN